MGAETVSPLVLFERMRGFEARLEKVTSLTDLLGLVVTTEKEIQAGLSHAVDLDEVAHTTAKIVSLAAAHDLWRGSTQISMKGGKRKIQIIEKEDSALKIPAEFKSDKTFIGHLINKAYPFSDYSEVKKELLSKGLVFLFFHHVDLGPKVGQLIKIELEKKELRK